MNPTYVLLDARRQARVVATWMFVVALPVGMYLLFGTQSSGDTMFGDGNVKAYIMASMATYAASMAACSIAGGAATEAILGWGRQVALTRARPSTFVVDKLVLATLFAMIGAAATFAAGLATGAELDDSWRWFAAFAMAVAGSALFALFGLSAALWFRSETAVSAASASLVFFAFFGNVFTPLSGTMLAIAKWTPMYGYNTLVHWPQLHGQVTDGDVTKTDSLWLAVANLIAWFLVFGVLAVTGLRRARAR